MGDQVLIDEEVRRRKRNNAHLHQQEEDVRLIAAREGNVS